jgi:hypothetical protein
VNPRFVELYGRLGPREEDLHHAIDNLLDVLGVTEDDDIDSARIAMLDACCDVVAIEH